MTIRRYELDTTLAASFAPRLGTPSPVYDDSGELAGYVAQHVEPRGSWFEMYDTGYNSYGEATGNTRQAAERQLRGLVGRGAVPARHHSSARLRVESARML